STGHSSPAGVGGAGYTGSADAPRVGASVSRSGRSAGGARLPGTTPRHAEGAGPTAKARLRGGTVGSVQVLPRPGTDVTGAGVAGRGGEVVVNDRAMVRTLHP